MQHAITFGDVLFAGIVLAVISAVAVGVAAALAAFGRGMSR